MQSEILKLLCVSRRESVSWAATVGIWKDRSCPDAEDISSDKASEMFFATMVRRGVAMAGARGRREERAGVERVRVDLGVRSWRVRGARGRRWAVPEGTGVPRVSLCRKSMLASSISKSLEPPVEGIWKEGSEKS